MKKPLKIILIILAVLIGLVAALLIWLTATQLNVKTETAVVTHGENSIASFAPGDSVSILTWNVGYAGDRGRPLDPLLRHRRGRTHAHRDRTGHRARAQL